MHESLTIPPTNDTIPQRYRQRARRRLTWVSLTALWMECTCLVVAPALLQKAHWPLHAVCLFLGLEVASTGVAIGVYALFLPMTHALRPVLGGVGLTSAGGFLITLGTTFPLILFGAFVLGSGIGLILAPAGTLRNHLAEPAQHVERWQQGVWSAWIAAIVGSVVAGIFTVLLAWQLIFWCESWLLLCFGVGIMVLPEPPLSGTPPRPALHQQLAQALTHLSQLGPVLARDTNASVLSIGVLCIQALLPVFALVATHATAMQAIATLILLLIANVAGAYLASVLSTTIPPLAQRAQQWRWLAATLALTALLGLITLAATSWLVLTIIASVVALGMGMAMTLQLALFPPAGQVVMMHDQLTTVRNGFTLCIAGVFILVAGASTTWLAISLIVVFLGLLRAAALVLLAPLSTLPP